MKFMKKKLTAMLLAGSLAIGILAPHFVKAEAEAEAAEQTDLSTMIRKEEEEDTEPEAVPQTLPLGQQLIRLRLPENETFADENWELVSVQLNGGTVVHLAQAGLGGIRRVIEDPEGYPMLLAAGKDFFATLREAGATLMEGNLGKERMEKALSAAGDLACSCMDRLFARKMTRDTEGTGKLEMVLPEAPTVYLLYNAPEAEGEVRGLAVLFRGHWYDLGAFKMVSDQIVELVKKGEIPEVSTILGIAQDTGAAVMRLAASHLDATGTGYRIEEEQGAAADDVQYMLGAARELGDYLFSGADPDDFQYLLRKPVKALCLPTAGLRFVELL